MNQTQNQKNQLQGVSTSKNIASKIQENLKKIQGGSLLTFIGIRS